MDFEGNITNEEMMNPGAFYEYARSKVKTKEGISDLEDENVQLTTQDTGKADLFNKFFCSFLQQRTQTLSPISWTEPFPTP